MPTPAIPASSRQEHNQTMTSESWFAIDSDDSPLRNRKITTVVLANLTDTLLRAAADDRAFGLLGFNALLNEFRGVHRGELESSGVAGAASWPAARQVVMFEEFRPVVDHEGHSLSVR